MRPRFEVNITYIPTLRDVCQARKIIAGHIPRTPLQHSAGLSQLLEAEVYLKRDEHLPYHMGAVGQALKGKKLAVVVSGGNITLEHLMDSIKLYQRVPGEGISGQEQAPV